MKQILILTALVTAGCSPRDPDMVVAYGRENNSGTYMYFKEHVLANADFAPEIQTLPGTAAVINAVSRDKRSIGYGGVGYVKGVKTLRVKKDASSPAVDPTLEAVVSGSYPISRYLYFYTVGAPEGEAKHLIDWVLSAEGQKVCSEVGYYPLPGERKAADAAGTSSPQTLTMKGSDTMVILGQRWAEHYMRRNPETVIQVTGGGSGTGIAALINGATNICQASRPMNKKERDQIKAKFGKDAIEIPVAMDGIAIFVHESNPVQEITLEQLKGVYTGKIRSWKDLGWKE